MDFLPSVIRAKYDGGFRIHLTFNDNLQGTVDIGGLAGRPDLRTVEGYFQRFFLSSSTAAPLCGRMVPTSRPKRCTKP
jgi:hypothetical protein